MSFKTIATRTLPSGKTERGVLRYINSKWYPEGEDRLSCGLPPGKEYPDVVPAEHYIGRVRKMITPGTDAYSELATFTEVAPPPCAPPPMRSGSRPRPYSLRRPRGGCPSTSRRTGTRR